VTDKKKLGQMIEQVRMERFAYVEQELELGLCSLAYRFAMPKDGSPSPSIPACLTTDVAERPGRYCCRSCSGPPRLSKHA